MSVEEKSAEVVADRLELRFSVPTHILDAVRTVFRTHGLQQIHLPEQGGAGSSNVQTLYLGTRELRTPRSYFIRLRSYPTTPQAGPLILTPATYVSLEIKDRATANLPQTKIRRSIQLAELLSAEGQQQLIPPKAREEVCGNPLIPLVAVLVTREYYAEGSLAGPYITIDQNFRFWGFFPWSGLTGQVLGGEDDICRVEIKGFRPEQKTLTNTLEQALLNLGGNPQDPLFLETLLRNRYVEALSSHVVLE